MVSVGFKVAVACTLMQLGFAGNPVILRLFADQQAFNMSVFSMMRNVLATPLLLFGATCVESPGFLPVSPTSTWEVFMFIIMGCLGMGGQQLCYLLGLYFTQPTVAAIFQQSISCWALFFAIISGQEPIPKITTRKGALRIAGLVLGVSGAVATTLASASHGNEHIERNPLLGCMFLVINTGMVGLYITIQKSLIFSPDAKTALARYSSLPLHVTAWTCAGGTVFSVFSALFGYLLQLEVLQFGSNNDAAGTNTLILPASAIYPLIFALLIPTCFCFVLMSYANKHADSSLVAMSWPIQVPAVVILSVAAGVAHITMAHVFGTLLVVAGLICVSLSSLLGEYSEVSQADFISPDDEDVDRPCLEITSLASSHPEDEDEDEDEHVIAEA
mmetsp:Transcript_13740/g.26624  ORF Transcript_13740/g.26624 Transcript_13740/m.26624 type:complete len:388 (-) Transcript_13740:115-1278(-)